MGSDAWNSASQCFYFYFSNLSFNSPFFGEDENFASPMLKTPVFWEYHIPAATYHLNTASFRYLQNGPAFFERSFHYTQRSQPDDISLAHHIISSELRPAAPSSASSAAQRRAVLFHGVPWRAMRYCCGMLCGVVRCCAVLCRRECFAVLTLILLIHNKNAPTAQLGPQLYITHSSAAPCGVMRCRALPCGAMLFHTALCFLSNIQQ